VALVYLWFGTVTAHRIGEPPSFAGFAGVFQTGCGDFGHCYHEALAMREGSNVYRFGVRVYVYPPLIAFLFMPLTWLSVQSVALVMLAVNMALVLRRSWLATTEAIRRFDIDASPDGMMVVVALTTLLSATRLRGELQMWQTNVLMMVALLLALRFLDSRPWLSGLLLLPLL
jgi:hypothetical protein